MADGKDSSRLQRELVKITDTPGPRVKALGKPTPRAGILVSSGSSPVNQNSGGEGIASPLTEMNYTTRLWYLPYNKYTTDGIFTFTVQDLASIDYTDAKGRVVQFKPADTQQPPP